MAGAADRLPHVLPVEATFAEAAARILGRHLPWLAAVDARGRVVGALSEEDLRLGLASEVQLHEPIRSRLRPIEESPLPLGVGRRPLPWTPPPPPPVREALVMAGGLGTRLRPYTDDCPKPLLPVGGRPLLFHVLDGLESAGIERVWISIRYLGERIRRAVGDGGGFGLEARYLEEDEPLGTAGSLGLLPRRPERLLVVNGDVLCALHYPALFAWHGRHGRPATMATWSHELRVLYGVVRFDGAKVEHIEEKPTLRLPVNAGIYLFEREVLAEVPRGRPFDMATWLNDLAGRGLLGHFPLVESWTDIGSPEAYERVRAGLPRAAQQD